jgi:hypothetical protein
MEKKFKILFLWFQGVSSMKKLSKLEEKKVENYQKTQEENKLSS